MTPIDILLWIGVGCASLVLLILIAYCITTYAIMIKMVFNFFELTNFSFKILGFTYSRTTQEIPQ